MHSAQETATGPLFTDPTPEFYREMKRRVDAWFVARTLPRNGGPRALLKAFGFMAAAIVCYFLVLSEVTGKLGLWLLAMAQGTCMFLFAMNSAHDATHNALVGSRRWNRVLWFCWDLVGISSWTTNLNHLRSHHVAPNIHALDIAVGNEVAPLLRLHPDAPHSWWHRYQHVYFPFAYAVGTLHKWFLVDILELHRNSFGNRKGHPDAPRELVLMVCFKLFVFTYALGVPLAVMQLQWWEVLIGFVSMHAVPGTIIALTFQVTHISDGVDFPDLRADGRVDGSRALHNLKTTTDLMPQSRLLNWVTGGISVHLTHHLFPEVSHRHLPDLALIVEAVAREYGVPYRKHLTLMDAVRAHVRALRRFSVPPGDGVRVPQPAFRV